MVVLKADQTVEMMVEMMVVRMARLLVVMKAVSLDRKRDGQTDTSMVVWRVDPKAVSKADQTVEMMVVQMVVRRVV